MPKYIFRCVNDDCLTNLTDDERLAKAHAAFGHFASPAAESDGSVEVSFPSYAAMREAEAAGGPKCSVCDRQLKRRPSAPGIGTTRNTTPAKKALDWMVGNSADSQWRMVGEDRERFGGEKASRERIERFKKEDAEAKKQAADMVKSGKLALRKPGGES